MKPDGGPAFPRSQTATESLASALVRSDSGKCLPDDGMSLRDYFAAAALQGMLAAWPVPPPLTFEAAASGAYQYADAMLAERAKG